jgi:hypothetical protein
VDWHLDPVAGKRAPTVHWSRVDPLDRSTVGDSKVTWELNRQQWLLPLGQAYWLTADRRYADEAVDLVDDWCRANPYGVGINWSSSLEVAYRLIAWSWTFMLIRDAGALSAREFAGLLHQVQTHASHIERFLSRYFSPNTHLTGEALSLLYASLLFPELAGAGRWRRLSRQVLIEECRRQIHADGVHFEQATCYQRYTIDIYLHFLILSARNGMAVPADVRQRVIQMVEFLVAVCGPDGAMPQIGDADGGWLLPLMRRGPSDCRGTLAVAASLFDRGDFLEAAGGPAPEALWLLGATGWNHLKSLRRHPPAMPASRVFREGGYAVMRGGWNRDAHQMIVDVGPLGCDVSGAHGHADLLSVHCSAFGEPYIVDPGTFCYTADPDWRNYFRSTAAHSTVVVDGKSQALPRGPFGWQSRPSVAIRDWASSDAFDMLDAWHDAYGSLPDPVRHRRRVVFVKPAYWIIVDDLLGREEHDLEIRFQLASRRVVACANGWVAVHGRRGEGLWLGSFSEARITVSVREGTENPRGGWVSPIYGQRRPAPSAIFESKANLPARFVTLVLPASRLGPAPPELRPLFNDRGRVVGLTFLESGETIFVDEETIGVRRPEQVERDVASVAGSAR